MFSSRGTVRYVERGQGYRDVGKVGKRCSKHFLLTHVCHTLLRVKPVLCTTYRNKTVFNKSKRKVCDFYWSDLTLQL